VVEFILAQRGEMFDPRMVDTMLLELDAFVAIRQDFPD
jgi:response regulator RpfG family c-di-GMP phosphodiesterase